MNENEDNFLSLRRLLALKRHEVPPPGYFNNFSGQVIGRIRAGHARAYAGAAERLADRAPWLYRLLRILEVKPAFIGSFAVALCLMLLGGIVYCERSEYAGPQAGQPPFQQIASASPASMVSPTLAAAGPAGVALTSVNLQPGASLFGGQNPLAQPVSFSIPGN